jgi:voltage-gated potassium channel
MLKQKVFDIIEKDDQNNRVSRYFDIFISSLIFLNIFAIVLESFKELKHLYLFFEIFELITVIIFSFEYILRLWTADLLFQGLGKIKSRFRFVFSFLGIVDLIAILPFYLPFFVNIDLRMLRIMRLTRLLRIFKLNRYSRSLSLIGRVLRKKKDELSATIFITFILLLFASTLMYYIERSVQPEAFSNIVETFWWAIATLTTVGYGDVYPITGWGRFLGGIIAVLGIGIVALPTGILSSAFLDELNSKESDKTCPHCGKEI